MYTDFYGASFITTPYKRHFTSGVCWGIKKPRLYQHMDLAPGDGLPMFIKDFYLENAENVLLRYTALGAVDIFVNGVRVCDDELKPGWTCYPKRALFDTVDITKWLQPGNNRILAVLATGWYSGRNVGDYYGGNAPAFMCVLLQNEKPVLRTDNSWLCTVGGAIRMADIWDGEYRDETKETYTELSKPNYTVTENWHAPEIFTYEGEVTPFIGEKIRVREGLCRKPDTITVYDGITYNGTNYGEIHVCAQNPSLPLTVKKGQTVIIDLAQELVGWANIQVTSEKGNEIRIRYAEFLNDSGDIARGNDGAKGSLYTINLRSALAKSYYVTNGAPVERYRPTFTFYGFRYIELTAQKDFTLLDITAEVVGSDTKETGKIETSDPLVNRLFSNALWGQRGNYLSVPTDCPQRDERLGWTGDAQVFSVTASYNADVLEFFRKWLQDMRDSQSEEGAYPDVVPRVECCNSENACAWGDAGIIIPYNMYRQYGDISLLKEHFASMEKYMAQLNAKYGLSGPIPRYGDWLAYDWCDNRYISSAYYIHDLDLMKEMSLVLGKNDRADFYADLREQAYGYFTEHFMENGKLKGTSQCEKVIALAFKLITGAKAEALAKELTQQIKDNDNRLSTGFLGTYNLCPTLSAFKQDKMAYTLLMQRKEPSWLYSVDQGATTVWERWNSYTLENGFGDVGMNSFNHYAYGAIVEWMYRYMAGIEAGAPGFETVLLQPRPDFRTEQELPDGQRAMKWVKAEYHSVKGKILSAWSLENGFTYSCTVPCKATLLLPVTEKSLLINGERHSFEEYKITDGCAELTLPAGSYEFVQKA